MARCLHMLDSCTALPPVEHHGRRYTRVGPFANGSLCSSGLVALALLYITSGCSCSYCSTTKLPSALSLILQIEEYTLVLYNMLAEPPTHRTNLGNSSTSAVVLQAPFPEPSPWHPFPFDDYNVNGLTLSSAESTGELLMKREVSPPASAPVETRRRPTLEDMFELEPSLRAGQKLSSHNIHIRREYPESQTTRSQDPRLQVTRHSSVGPTSSDNATGHSDSEGATSYITPSSYSSEVWADASCWAADQTQSSSPRDERTKPSQSPQTPPEIDWDKDIRPATSRGYQTASSHEAQEYEIDWNCDPYESAIRYKSRESPDSMSPEPLGDSSSGTHGLSEADHISRRSHAQSIRRFLEKCGLHRRHCETYAVHFENMGIPTLQDLDALIRFRLEDQLLHVLKKNFGARWLQMNLIKNGLEKHRKRLSREMSDSPQSS